jgi:ABC-type polysaccharide/polyol phosphate transport system ATPase subunit
MQNIIQARNVSKVFRIPHLRTAFLKSYLINFKKARSYESFHALKNLSLSIQPGEFIGLIGKNGSWKSTLLKLIAEILYPTSGTIEVHAPISSFLELGVGFNPELTARDNIFLYCAIMGMSRKEAEESFPEILEYSELEHFIDSPLKTYSSGMQVRLAFSVAIQARSPILLVDEVLAVGDAAFQKKCFQTFEQFKNEGKTIIFVSHDMDSIQRFCDRVIFLQNGEEISEGKPKEIVKRYMQSLDNK